MESLEQVFNNIVKDYSERLFWHVRRMVNSHEDAEARINVLKNSLEGLAKP